MQTTTRLAFALRLVFAAALLGQACTRAPETARTEQSAAEARSTPPSAETPNAEARDAPPAPSGKPRAPDVPYEPSPNRVVSEIVKLAELRSGDVVYDLGCGDGRIVIAAVKTPGVRGVCIDIDPERIRESRENARAAGVSERIDFRTQDLFEADIADATVVTLFLWPQVNLKLRPKLQRDLRPGTRVISYMHDMGDWRPERTVPVQANSGPSSVYLWTIAER
jgi:SAM-dependent methyltransferase